MNSATQFRQGPLSSPTSSRSKWARGVRIPADHSTGRQLNLSLSLSVYTEKWAYVCVCVCMYIYIYIYILQIYIHTHACTHAHTHENMDVGVQFLICSFDHFARVLEMVTSLCCCVLWVLCCTCCYSGYKSGSNDAAPPSRRCSALPQPTATAYRSRPKPLNP